MDPDLQLIDYKGGPPAGGDQNLGPAIIGVNVVVFTASTVIVILRTITRIWLTRNFGWDGECFPELLCPHTSCVRSFEPFLTCLLDLMEKC